MKSEEQIMTFDRAMQLSRNESTDLFGRHANQPLSGLRTGETLPDNAIAELKKYDSIYLGAIGHPDVKPGILEKGVLLRLRFELDQYIN